MQPASKARGEFPLSFSAATHFLPRRRHVAAGSAQTLLYRDRFVGAPGCWYEGSGAGKVAFGSDGDYRHEYRCSGFASPCLPPSYLSPDLGQSAWSARAKSPTTLSADLINTGLAIPLCRVCFLLFTAATPASGPWQSSVELALWPSRVLATSPAEPWSPQLAQQSPTQYTLPYCSGLFFPTMQTHCSSIPLYC